MNYSDLLDIYRIEYRSRQPMTYADFIAFAQSRSPLHALAILVSNYNGQVLNGGHIQYVDNGYAHGVGGCFSEHPTTEMHDLMLSLFVNLGLAQDAHFHVPFTIMKMLAVDSTTMCYNCDGRGYTTYLTHDDFEVDEDCCECNGSGFLNESSINVELAESLDDLYYAISESFMADFESFVNERLAKEN